MGNPSDPYGRGGDMPDPGQSAAGTTYLGVPDNYLAPPNPASFGEHYYPSGYNYTHHQYPGGLPSEYRGGHKGYSPSARRAPIYKQGDEYRPRNADPNAIFATQQALASMGLLTGHFTGKVWDEPTAAAWRKVLEYANQAGITDEQAMVELGHAAERGGRFTVDDAGNVVPIGSDGAAPPPLITHVTDPKIVKEIFRQSAIQIAGIGWDDKRLTQAAATYNALERHAQEAAYNAELHNKSTEVVDVPNPSDYAEAMVRDADPEAVQEHDALSYAGQAMQFLTGPAWGLGSQ